MRLPTPHTRALIERLNKPVSLWEKLEGSRDEAALLSRIGDSDEPAAIIDILPFLMSESTDVASAAASAVHKLILRTPSTELGWLDWALRRRSPYKGRYGFEWHNLTPAQLGLFEGFGDISVSLFGMSSCHLSGYVREAAIKRLDLITGGAELPFLIFRTNDWVPNVREAAYRAIGSRLKPEYCQRFIANLTLIARLKKAGRADHRALTQAIDELLKSADCRSALLESLESKDRFVRRGTFRLAIDSGESDLPEVLRKALDDSDTVIRSWAAQKVSSALEGETLDHFLTLMKNDRFMPVRREALRICIKRSTAEASGEMRAALLDTHASMREEARYHLQKIGPIDLATFYRQSLTTAEASKLYSAISGLGETGSTQDDHRVIGFMSHQAAKIRRAAIKAIARLNQGAHPNLFIEALKDEAPPVSRQALKALADRSSSVSGHRVWEILHSASQDHVKLNALSLIEKLGKWESIFYLVTTLRDSDEAVAGMSHLAIERWLARFNRSFSAPTREQLLRLSSALEDSGDLLNETAKAELQFSMKGFEQQ